MRLSAPETESRPRAWAISDLLKGPSARAWSTKWASLPSASDSAPDSAPLGRLCPWAGELAWARGRVTRKRRPTSSNRGGGRCWLAASSRITGIPLPHCSIRPSSRNTRLITRLRRRLIPRGRSSRLRPGMRRPGLSISIRSSKEGLLCVGCEQLNRESQHSELLIAASKKFAKIRSRPSRLLHRNDCRSDAPRLLQLLPITWVDQAG